MNERDFVGQIVSSWSLLKDVFGIGRFIISQQSLPVDGVFREISLSELSTYEDVFRTGLSRSNYNILLRDYAFFQFSREADDAWRLAYFPNPWLSGMPSAEDRLLHWESLEEQGAFTHEEVSDLITEEPYVGAVPPVRFEYAPSQYRELAHPAAHFHIGLHSENRWPSSIALGPTAFTMLIAKMYYPEAWGQCSRFHGAITEDCIEQRFIRAAAETGAVLNFSENERRSFHFGKLLGSVQNGPGWRQALARPFRRG